MPVGLVALRTPSPSPTSSSRSSSSAWICLRDPPYPQNFDLLHGPFQSPPDVIGGNDSINGSNNDGGGGDDGDDTFMSTRLVLPAGNVTCVIELSPHCSLEAGTVLASLRLLNTCSRGPHQAARAARGRPSRDAQPRCPDPGALFDTLSYLTYRWGWSSRRVHVSGGKTRLWLICPFPRSRDVGQPPAGAANSPRMDGLEH